MKIKTLDDFFAELNNTDLSIAVNDIFVSESTGIYSESSFVRIILGLANKQFPKSGRWSTDHFNISDAEKSCFREAAKRFSSMVG